MSRPLNKAQLLNAIQAESAILEKLLNSLTPAQMAAAPTPGAWAVKDILAHLYAWQQMFFGWYAAGQRGETPALPAVGYKWSQIPALNQHIYEQHCHLSAGQALALFRQSHAETLRFIESLPEDELTTPGYYAWLKDSSLLVYLNANTAAHYRWAVKDIRNTVKQLGLGDRRCLLDRLEATVAGVAQTYRALPEPDMRVYPGWSARDVLAHVLFWHESFARNVDDLAHGRMPHPLDGGYGDLNQAGVEAMRGQTLEDTLGRLLAAQSVIRENILALSAPRIPYRVGSRQYSPEEHLALVDDHINKHLRDVKKKAKI
jgi:hypothetical protein